ncbi:penicillin-binding protein [Leyella stercorea]|uniref:Penicillin-binding protein transpeptidase domain protein n=1 Tax=Leyella stercorea CAG:629 TaxID=1263103 RepID=R7GVB2_9BACT|nr:penicillin-binding protein [Leyella stercorea]CDE30678.1 penicillin-binding protein transpeptidase domain protein [Leyella stercorea CAG:629]
MSKFDSKKVMPRYSFLAILMTLVAITVVGKTLYIMTAKRAFWEEVADRVKVDSLKTLPIRGNILSCDGQLMASSLPQYNIFMDFVALREAKKDTLFEQKLDSICMGLNAIFPDRSAEEFKKHLMEGFEKNKRHWPIWNRRINYSTFSEVKSLPVFNLSKNQSGFHWDEHNARKLAYGSLAGRTIGKMYGAKDTAQCGLELSYDSLLRGEEGIRHRRKVLNKYLDIVDTPPVNGADIVTTIDVSMQDLAERALLKELRLINANVGVAIVMEVKTGDVKAIVNMTKCADDDYHEIKNHAISDLLEPGSVFKTASIMVALDDGVVDTTYRVETAGGVWPMYGREMKDHNWRRGGYGMLTLPQTLMVSSNIGVSRIIDDHYHNTPEKYVQGIYRLGLADDLHIPLQGASPARIRMPKKDARGKQYVNWSKTTLPWMSIGYETQVPPISTLTFYNAIANGGKMMAPRFVKAVMKDGVVIKEFEPVVLRERIAKETTIKKITTILEHVVSQGLGKKAGSQSFLVAGKTGTAQISKGAAGYKSGQMNYLLSFAGFFPAYEPRYSCIVCIQKSGLPASGGGMSGVVFHDIAEGIMAQSLKLEATDARDSLSVLIPQVKNGNMLAASYVLDHLGIKQQSNWDGSYLNGNPIWGHALESSGKTIALHRVPEVDKNTMPDVHGMGAKDAVYLIESRGVKVKLNGRGKVMEQSIGAGQHIKKGMVCSLRLG